MGKSQFNKCRIIRIISNNNLNSSGVLGDKVWATAKITILPVPNEGGSELNNGNNSDGNIGGIGSNKSVTNNLNGSGKNTLPTTDYESSTLFTMAGMILIYMDP